MGMFDEVNFEVDCPKCNEKVIGFQSKSGPCDMLNLQIAEMDDGEHIYSKCKNCGSWLEGTIKDSQRMMLQEVTIRDVEIEVKEGLFEG